MKNPVKLVLLLVVAIGGIAIYKHVNGGGTISMGRPVPKSGPQRELAQLSKQFSKAEREFAQAERTAAAGGMDISSDAAGVYEDADRIERELAALRGRLSDPAAIAEADSLLVRIRSFKARIR